MKKTGKQRKEKRKAIEMSEQVPDGFVIVHRTYFYGPFPTEEMATLISDATLCNCKRDVRPLFLPPGIIVAIDPGTLVAGLKSRQLNPNDPIQ